MDKQLQEFIKDFKRVKALGFHPSRRSHNTGVGKTYEDLLGIVENNTTDPDLHGFEIKSQRAYTGSYVTLFTKSPTMPPRANTYLKDQFGSQDEKLPHLKVLHTSVFHGKFNTHKSTYRFSLERNDDEERLYLLVANSAGDIQADHIYWSYDALRHSLNKLNRLAYVSAKTRMNENGKEEFHFNKAKIFSGFKGLDNFLTLLSDGQIMFDIRIGLYRSGKNKGKTHDHGSGFRIKREHMNLLYDDVLEL